MSDTSLAETKARIAAAHALPADIGWLDSLGWNDRAVPAIKNAGQLADYERRERVLNQSIAHLSFPERAESPEGRMAAALGARIADWRDKAAGDDAD